MTRGGRLSLPPRRRWTVKLIHHAHTDIGYTDAQPIIGRRHVQYIDEALALIARADAGDASLRGFRWTSECFWSVENWLRATPASRHAELAEAIRRGNFGLSGTYVHLAEIADDHLIRQSLARAVTYARALGMPLDTAVSADVNGFGWGYAQALHDCGINNLLVCLHACHGVAPVAPRQTPFLWESTRGDRVLVWLGEHYMLGNILGLAPGAQLEYDFSSEIKFAAGDASADEVAAERLPRYLAHLEQRGYAFDFVPVHVSGLATDNSPPSAAIPRFVESWNAQHGHSIRIEMTTASAFSAHVRATVRDSPIYRGDWPDWWTDGVASAPEPTRHFRRARLAYEWRRALAASGGPAVAADEARGIEDALALYAEHTFGHAQSVLAPWSADVTALAAGKAAYATAASQLAGVSLDEAFLQLGGDRLRTGRAYHYRVTNPLPFAVRDCTRLTIEPFDQDAPNPVEVVDCATDAIVPHQAAPLLGAGSVEVRLNLAAGQSVQLALRRRTRPEHSTSLVVATANQLDSPFVQIRFSAEPGATSWRERTSGQSLLAPRALHAPFTPVRDVTPVSGGDPRIDGDHDQVRVRGTFGLNRKGPDARCDAGQLAKVTALEHGPLRATVQLEFSLPGCVFYRVLLSVWADLPRVDAVVRLLKAPTWAPENLYVALPFAAPAADPAELWIDKPGALLRPAHDLLPGALTDFTSVESGFALVGGNSGIVVATPDAPLLQLGSLAPGARELAGRDRGAKRPAYPYSWIMTNFWETNFRAETGGFHEFAYRVEWGAHLATPADAFTVGRALCHGLRNFRCSAS
jgi:predicted small integral membrane protein